MSDPWKTWPYHRPGSALSFPRDEGWHRLLPLLDVANPTLNEMEWVYLNAHVREKSGPRTFVIFAAYFTQHLRFLLVRAFDASDNPIGVWTGTAWGLLKPSADLLDLSFQHGGGTDRWRTVRDSSGQAKPWHSQLEARDDSGKFSIDITMHSEKVPYEAGGLGHLPFGTSGSFFYYSLTRLALEGELWLKSDTGGEETVEVEGFGWYDHQWGPFYVTPFRTKNLEEYEWMSIQLDSGDEILLTTVWEPTGETPSLAAYGGAGLIRADGTFDELVGAHRWQRTAFWHSPDQHGTYAARWRFVAPEWGTDLEIVPRTPDQLTPIVDNPPPNLLGAVSHLFSGWANWLGAFWEGSCRVTGTFAGSPATGFAFAELIKRYEDPELVIDVARNDPALTVVRWRVTNPDEQVALRHRVSLERGDGTVLVDRADLEVPVFVFDQPGLPTDEDLLVRVTSSSVDGTISGTATRDVRLR